MLNNIKDFIPIILSIKSGYIINHNLKSEVHYETSIYSYW
jgi:hypothetical protein